MLTVFEGLWEIVQSFIFCLRPLLWTMLFIGIIIFIDANFASQRLGWHAWEIWDGEEERTVSRRARAHWDGSAKCGSHAILIR